LADEKCNAFLKGQWDKCRVAAHNGVVKMVDTLNNKIKENLTTAVNSW
jgi:predicted glutamine amidotransferase